MKIKILSLCILMFLGCATVTDFRLSKQFEKVAESYSAALRWEDFELAKSFVSKQNLKGGSTLPDPDILKKIKITSYDLQNLKMNTEKLMVEQTVEIKYYNTDYLIEKIIHDNQIWIYESDSWYLSTGLPVFE